MKRIFALLLSAVLGVCLAACVQSPDTASKDNPSDTVASGIDVSSAGVESVPESQTDESSEISDMSSEDSSGYDPITGDPSKVIAVIPDELPVYEEGSVRLLAYGESPYGFGELLPEERPYRLVYYQLFGNFCDNLLFLRDDGSISNFYTIFNNEFYEFQQLYPSYNPNAEEMVLVSAIKWFNITREEMEQLVQIEANWLQEDYFDDWRDSEACELPNLDILYTLDNDIINEYYRYG